VLDRLTAITVPTLMLTGDRDYSPVVVKKAVVDAMQNARLVVIPDSGHGTPIEKPEETNQAIEAFIRDVSATG
jgi:pimeloyl-ACP methyl ester carboxylesterase